ncbi:MAG: hypothetical protein ACPGVO_18815 [Spirulinaceae cyanobacterium]
MRNEPGVIVTMQENPIQLRGIAEGFGGVETAKATTDNHDMVTRLDRRGGAHRVEGIK